jgi:GNAT superfamily N-acetyltransferase
VPQSRYSADVESDALSPPELAETADLESLVDTLASAFADDVMIRWPMPDATREDDQALFRAIMAPYVELGVAWKIGDALGCAAWLPPAEAAQFAEIELATRDEINRLTSDGGARYAKFWDWIESHLPAEPCWLLDLVGVRPDRQGLGIGRTLVTHGVKRAHAAGQPAFLETGNRSNVALYEALGFRVVHHEPAPDGGPMIWFMQA